MTYSDVASFPSSTKPLSRRRLVVRQSTGDQVQVLHAHRNSEERRQGVRSFFEDAILLPRVADGVVREDAHECLKSRVLPFDACEIHANQLFAGDVAPPKVRCLVDRGGLKHVVHEAVW